MPWSLSEYTQYTRENTASIAPGNPHPMRSDLRQLIVLTGARGAHPGPDQMGWAR